MTKSWKNVRHILAVRLDAMGDVLMTGPALQIMKQASKAKVTMLTSTAGAEAARLIPGIDNVIVFDTPWMKPEAGLHPSREDFILIEKLRRLNCDAAVIFTVFSQSSLPAALMCHLAGIPLRAAYSRENPYHLLNHWQKEREPHEITRHEVRRQIDLVMTLPFTGAKKTAVAADNKKINVSSEPGFVTKQSYDIPPATLPYRIAIEPAIRARAIKALKDAGVDTFYPWVIVHPGASASSRRYPASNFAKLAQALSLCRYQVVFTGTPSERELIENIQNQMIEASYSMAGRLTLTELMALVASSPLVISNNTGTVHVACSVGTPVVALYALTNPQHRPWNVQNKTLSYDVPCKYCYKSVCPEGHNRCLTMIEPAQVVQAAAELLPKNILCTLDAGAGADINLKTKRRSKKAPSRIRLPEPDSRTQP